MAARRPTRQSARPWRWASTSPTCRSTSKASSSANWRPAEPRLSWSPRHTSPPPGWSSPARRHALIGWARRGGGYVIEDDYDSEFRYDKEPVGALQGLAPDQVFLLGTASKALAPAVRLGWVHAPSSLASSVAAEKEMSDRGSCTLDQLALATLLTTGGYDRHLRRRQTVSAARRTA